VRGVIRFADHLAATLSHSLTLCSGSAETSLDLFARGEVSPITTPFEVDSFFTPLIQPSNDYFNVFRPKREPSIPEISPFKRFHLMEMLQSWSFSPLDLPQDELWECACIMLEACLRLEGVKPDITMRPFALLPANFLPKLNS
jgi:hypothetical protein